MGKTSKRKKTKSTSKTFPPNTRNRKRKADDGMDTTASCTLRNYLGGKEIVEVFSVVITAAFFQVAIHKKEDLWTTSSFWKHCADSLKNLGLQNIKGKKALLACVLRYILSPDGSFLMFGDDHEHQNKSLQVRMNTQYKRRGHDPIFIIVSDVPEYTLLLKRILQRCPIQVIELKAKDFSSDANVSQLSAVSAAILNGAKNSNDDVNQMPGVDLAQVGIALVLKKDLEQTEPARKKSNYIRTLTAKGKNLIKNFGIADEEGNVDIKGIRGTVVKKKKSQSANFIYNIKFEDGHEETMDDEEVIVCAERYNIQMLLNARVAKYFNKKLYFGTVIDFCSDEKWWRVKYDDDDEEDLEHHQIIQAKNLRDKNAKRDSRA